MAALLVCALPVVAGASTSVQFIEVTARQDWVLSGRTLQLEARAMNLYGATLSNVTLAWQSSNRAVAEVDNAGRVRGLRPGKTNITASAGSVSGAFTVAVHPARMEIEPGNPELRVGEKVTLTAQAFDADGNPLAGLRFSWSSGQPGVASVSTQGEVLGRAEGSTTIAASLDIADLLPGFSAQTTVAVRGAGDFALERLISNEFETRPVVLRNIGEMSHAGNDQVVFDTALSNGSQALMAWDNGVLEAVAFSGQYLDDLGLLVERFERMSVNTRGDVLTRTFFPYHPWDGLVLFRRESSGLVPVLVTLPSSFCCPEVSSFGLGEDGEAVFTASDEAGWRHLFLRNNGRDLNTVAVAGSQLPGFGVPDWIGDAAIFRRGEIVFNANGPRGYGYFHWDGVEVRKIYATGDSILGRRIDDGERPIQTASGDFYVRMWGNGLDLIARLSGGEWSAVVESGQRLDGMDIHHFHQFHDVLDDTVLFAADTDQGSGLFTLAGGRLTKLAGFGEAPGEWRWIHQAFLRSAGGAIVMGLQGNLISRIARLGGGASTTVAQTGQSLDVAAPTSLDWQNLVVGRGASIRVVATSTGSLVSVGKDSIQTVLSPGDTLPGGRVMEAVYERVSNHEGKIAFHAQTDQGDRVYTWSEGAVAVVAESWSTTQAPGGGPIHWLSGPLGVNGNNTLVRAGLDQGEALLLFRSGASIGEAVMLSGADAPGGSRYQYAHSVAVDERGRVVFQAGLEDGSEALFFWENDAARRILSLGDQRPAGRIITQFQGGLQAASGEFFLQLGSGEYGQFQEIAAYDGDRWRVILSNGEQTTFGSIQHLGSFSVSGRGEVAYVAWLPGAAAVAFRDQQGFDLLVASTRKRSSEGEWFTDFRDVHLGGGEVLFSALSPTTLRDRLVLYRATRTGSSAAVRHQLATARSRSIQRPRAR